MTTPEKLPQRYSNFDVKMEWCISIKDRKTVIEGLIRNVRYSRMENIEIWVRHLDTREKTIGRAVELVTPQCLELYESTTFRLVLPDVVPPGAKLVFTYKYSGDDGGDASDWMQSFESNMV